MLQLVYSGLLIEKVLMLMIMCYKLVTRGLMSELLSLIMDVVGGTWLQLMCCTLSKCLCP